MKISDYLTKEMIFTGAKAEDKADALQVMLDQATGQGVIEQDRKAALLGKLMDREKMGSTGVGGGVAIPHASGENIERMMIAIGQFPDGVEFGAIDANPVKLIFMIIGPERDPRAHLRLLAALVRTIKNRDLLKSLMKASSPTEIYDLISIHDSR